MRKKFFVRTRLSLLALAAVLVVAWSTVSNAQEDRKPAPESPRVETPRTETPSPPPSPPSPPSSPPSAPSRSDDNSSRNNDRARDDDSRSRDNSNRNNDSSRGRGFDKERAGDRPIVRDPEADRNRSGSVDKERYGDRPIAPDPEANRYRDRNRDRVDKDRDRYRGRDHQRFHIYDNTIIYASENYGDYAYSASAYENGYRDGLYTGANDARRGQSYDPGRSHFFRNGAYGYYGAFGAPGVYQQAYRDGFLRGYQEGYANWQRYFSGGRFHR